MEKVKIHELAKNLGVDSKKLLEIAKENGIEAKSHLSSITKEESKVLERLLKGVFGKKSLKNINEKYKNLDYYNWLITLKNTKEIIGCINLRIDDHNDSVEFNYAIDNRFTNNGYMTETLMKIKQFALENLKVNRFQGGCCVENLASKKVMEKCGMHFEGTLRNYIKLKDGFHDMHMFSIINN